MHKTRSSFVAAWLVLAAGCLVPASASAAPRTVALTPFSANTMALLGVRPVAVGQALGDKHLFDKRLRGVKVLPLSHPSGPNMEQLATLNPKLVFSAKAWTRGHSAMKRLGARVAVYEPRKVGYVPRTTRQIGARLGKRAAANRLARQQEQQVRVATRNIKRRPKVLLVLGVGNTTEAFLPNSWGGNLIQRAGGRLITAGLKGSSGYARISDEAVVAANPDVIIVVPHGTPKSIPAIAKRMKNRPGWRTTRAARSGRIHVSTNNTLLQPIVNAGVSIVAVRKYYLRNW